tara:strand:- start:432 stop:677 length:246 start_codon:yes stop_codon:yes gene_type:complete
MSRTYLIIQASDVSSVDFAAVCETSAETLRYSVDSTKTFIKWDGEQPAFVSGLTGTEGPYTNAEIKTILATDVWTDPNADT